MILPSDWKGPELPVEFDTLLECEGDPAVEVFTATQMRLYARACAEAAYQAGVRDGARACEAACKEFEVGCSGDPWEDGYDRAKVDFIDACARIASEHEEEGK